MKENESLEYNDPSQPGIVRPFQLEKNHDPLLEFDRSLRHASHFSAATTASNGSKRLSLDRINFKPSTEEFTNTLDASASQQSNLSIVANRGTTRSTLPTRGYSQSRIDFLQSSPDNSDDSPAEVQRVRSAPDLLGLKAHQRRSTCHSSCPQDEETLDPQTDEEDRCSSSSRLHESNDGSSDESNRSDRDSNSHHHGGLQDDEQYNRDDATQNGLLETSPHQITGIPILLPSNDGADSFPMTNSSPFANVNGAVTVDSHRGASSTLQTPSTPHLNATTPRIGRPDSPIRTSTSKTSSHASNDSPHSTTSTPSASRSTTVTDAIMAEPSRLRLMMKLGLNRTDRSSSIHYPQSVDPSPQPTDTLPQRSSSITSKKSRDLTRVLAGSSRTNSITSSSGFFTKSNELGRSPSSTPSMEGPQLPLESTYPLDESLMLKGRGGIVVVNDHYYNHEGKRGMNNDEDVVSSQNDSQYRHYTSSHGIGIGASPQMDITTGYYPQDSSSIEFDREYSRRKQQRQREQTHQGIDTVEERDNVTEGELKEGQISRKSPRSTRLSASQLKDDVENGTMVSTLGRSFYRRSGGQSKKQSSSVATSSQSDSMEFRLNLVDLRSREDFRVNYLKKLSYANVWIPQARRPPQHQTISIFDWDDTLLCTSYINLRGDDAVCTTISKQLAAIEHHGKNLLTAAMKMGRVFVITNAMNGWVEYSARRYLPGLLRTLQSVSVISARHRFEGAFPGDYHRWKIQAFLEVQKTLNSQIITNLISVGDSTIEMDAVHIMGQEFSQALIKTIKFRENPSPDELAKQLELVSQKFEKICLNAKNLKIGLERRVIHPRQRSDAKSTTGATTTPGNPSSSNSSLANESSSKTSSNAVALSASSMGLLPIQQTFSNNHQN